MRLALIILCVVTALLILMILTYIACTADFGDELAEGFEIVPTDICSYTGQECGSEHGVCSCCLIGQREGKGEWWYEPDKQKKMEQEMTIACMVCCPMCDKKKCVGRFNCQEIKMYIEKHGKIEEK